MMVVICFNSHIYEEALLYIPNRYSHSPNPTPNMLGMTFHSFFIDGSSPRERIPRHFREAPGWVATLVRYA
jgi:hypothetical protein